MQFKTKDTGLLLRMTFNEWNEILFRQSAVIAYYAILYTWIISFNHRLPVISLKDNTVNQNIDQISSAMGLKQRCKPSNHKIYRV
jgi:hypothetical protein